jgi:thiol-disulfide isomerase/thioredoxin
VGRTRDTERPRLRSGSQTSREEFDDECDDNEGEEDGYNDRGDGSHEVEDSEHPRVTSTANSITFYTRQGCPLCDDAFRRLNPVAEKLGRSIEVVDIDLDLALLEKYNDRVPVIEYDDHVVAEGIVDIDVVATYLRSRD